MSKALAAYNAGRARSPGRWRPPYAETQNYVQKVLGYAAEYGAAAPAAAATSAGPAAAVPVTTTPVSATSVLASTGAGQLLLQLPGLQHALMSPPHHPADTGAGGRQRRRARVHPQEPPAPSPPSWSRPRPGPHPRKAPRTVPLRPSRDAAPPRRQDDNKGTAAPDAQAAAAASPAQPVARTGTGPSPSRRRAVTGSDLRAQIRHRVRPLLSQEPPQSLAAYRRAAGARRTGCGSRSRGHGANRRTRSGTSRRPRRDARHGRGRTGPCRHRHHHGPACRSRRRDAGRRLRRVRRRHARRQAPDPAELLDAEGGQTGRTSSDDASVQRDLPPAPTLPPTADAAARADVGRPAAPTRSGCRTDPGARRRPWRRDRTGADRRRTSSTCRHTPDGGSVRQWGWADPFHSRFGPANGRARPKLVRIATTRAGNARAIPPTAPRRARPGRHPPARPRATA